MVRAVHRRDDWRWVKDCAPFCGKGWAGMVHRATGDLRVFPKQTCLSITSCSHCAPKQVEAVLGHLATAIDGERVYYRSYSWRINDGGERDRLIANLKARRVGEHRFIVREGYPQEQLIHVVASMALVGRKESIHDWTPMGSAQAIATLADAMIVPGVMHWPGPASDSWVLVNPVTERKKKSTGLYIYIGAARTKTRIIEAYLRVKEQYEASHPGEVVDGFRQISQAEVLANKVVQALDREFVAAYGKSIGT